MEFGRLQSVEKVNWGLPQLSERSAQFLKIISDQKDKLQIHFGTPAWAHKEWIGKIYPARTKAADFLYHYSRTYSSVEFNSSHYRIPTDAQVAKWREQVPSEFRFCPKMFQGISHQPMGLADRELLNSWLRFLQSMQKNLGPCFLQLPPSFDYSKKALLHAFLKNWPSEFALALEFRHPSWFAEGEVLPLLTEYLQSRRIGVVMTDVAGRRDVLHSTVSAPFTIVRFIGNDLHPTDEQRLHLWAERLHQWKTQGLSETFFFLHETDDLLCPEVTVVAQKVFQQRGLTVLHRAAEVDNPPLGEATDLANEFQADLQL